MSFVYTVELSDAHYYVGQCINFNKEFMDKLITIPWVKYHGNPGIIKFVSGNDHLLADTTHALMIKYGVEKVRSDIYPNVELKTEQKRFLSWLLHTITGTCAESGEGFNTICKSFTTDDTRWSTKSLIDRGIFSTFANFTFGSSTSIYANNTNNVSTYKSPFTAPESKIMEETEFKFPQCGAPVPKFVPLYPKFEPSFSFTNASNNNNASKSSVSFAEPKESKSVSKSEDKSESKSESKSEDKSVSKPVSKPTLKRQLTITTDDWKKSVFNDTKLNVSNLTKLDDHLAEKKRRKD